MEDKHQQKETLTLVEYTKRQRRLHRQIIREQQAAGNLAVQRRLLKQQRQKAATAAALGATTLPTAENEQKDTDSDHGTSSNDSEGDFSIGDYYFLQPVSTRKRRTLLRQSGIKKIDSVEKDDCKDIRSSRELCGCDCRIYCDPDTCPCSQAGIKCQVDRLSFPCGCSKDGCANVTGRIEFNPIRVRTHFIHTVMRLEREKKQHLLLSQPGASLRSAPSTPSVPSELSDRSAPSSASNSPDSHTDTEAKFNSNEMGSCCDCQKSDIGDFMIRESQLNQNLAARLEQDSQNIGVPTANTSISSQNQTPQMLCNTPMINLDTKSPVDNIPQVAMFHPDNISPEVYNSDEEFNADGTPAAMCQFPQSVDGSSYSESSDCSSEGSMTCEEAARNAYQQQQQQQQQHQVGQYPISAQCPTTTDNNTPTDCTRANPSTYCIPAKIDYQPATAPPEQKFMELSSSTSGYKLEPISEILNPIRFPYNGSNNTNGTVTGQTWPENYCSYQDDANNQITPNGDNCASPDTYGMYTSADTSADTPAKSTVSTSLCGMQNLADNASHFMGFNGYSSQASACTNTERNMEFTQLNSKQFNPQSGGSFTQVGETNGMPMCEQNTLSNSCQYTELTNANKMVAQPASYTNLTTTNGHDSHPAPVQNGLTKPATVNGKASSPESSPHVNGFGHMDQPNGHQNVAKCVNGSKEEESSKSGKNFGEIIKESLVETVSA